MVSAIQRHYSKMGLGLLLLSVALSLLACYQFVRRMNGWYYDLKIRKKQYPLPPGDMGWPLIGNLWPFWRDFSSGQPDSFINKLVSRYGRTGIYKTHLFGNPCIIVCAPEMCWRVLTDDENFKLGYPKSIADLTWSRPFYSAEHRSFRRKTTTPLIGFNVVAMYIERIEGIVINFLEEMASMKHPVELSKELKKVTYDVILHVFMGSDNHSTFKKIRSLFTDMHKGIFALGINLPGFAFHKALKARRKAAGIINLVVDERRTMITSGQKTPKDLLDILLEVEDESGHKMGNEDIIDLLIVFLFAGQKTTAIAMMWSIIYLTDNPHVMKKATEEQEEIMKARPPSQKQIDVKEIRRMVYLAKVINETLRRTNISFTTFRQAVVDVNINGYVIPKGWRVLNWSRAIHMDPKYYANPGEFNPSRWDDYTPKAGTFIPFGAGSRLCPGIDLTKLQLSIFLHYFLLNYKMERVNPKCPITYMPSGKPIDNCLAKVMKIPLFKLIKRKYTSNP